MSAAIARRRTTEGNFERMHEPPPVISQRLWMADDCKGSAVPSLLMFAAGQMLSSSRG
jgi:hypothetical protein